jgi:hypothetical protein
MPPIVSELRQASQTTRKAKRISMRKALFPMAATTIVLVSGALCHGTRAMPAASVSAANRAVFQPIVNVCGTHGCVPVQTKRIIRRQKPGSIAAHHI